MKEILMKVTNKHIAEGVKEDECDCPIALSLNKSIQKHFDEEVFVSVYEDNINIHSLDDKFKKVICKIEPKNPEGWYTIGDFINEFDKGDVVYPFWLKMVFNPKQLINNKEK